VVADFRPERSPIRNMAEALAKPLTVKRQRLKQNCGVVILPWSISIPTLIFILMRRMNNGKTWKSRKKNDRKRKAANLMIIVDQFEEFFTNPENFYKEAPSQDSQIVVNLVLETARIAIKRNMPVYVVCTMRSDYIGQCSAFRGLPEYIGFSSIFCPKVKA
jgi:hypothetical protein